MSRKALVDSTGLVLNVIVIEDGADWPIPAGCILVDAAFAGGPGNTWSGTRFMPAPKVTLKLSARFQAILDALTLDQLKAALLQ